MSSSVVVPSVSSVEEISTGNEKGAEVNKTFYPTCQAQVNPEADVGNMQISDGRTKGTSRDSKCGIRTLKIVTSLICGVMLGIGLEKARGTYFIKISRVPVRKTSEEIYGYN